MYMTTPYWEEPTLALTYWWILWLAGTALAVVGMYQWFRASRNTRSKGLTAQLKIGMVFTSIGIVAAIAGIFIVHDEVSNHKHAQVVSLQDWLDSEYGIVVTNKSATSMLKAANAEITFKDESVTVDYDGNTIVVKLAPYGAVDDAWTLVDVTTLQPVAVK